MPDFIQDGKKASEGDIKPILHWLTRDRDVKAVDAVPYRLLERYEALSAGAAGLETLGAEVAK